MTDLFELSASEAIARIRAGNLTSEALVRSCLERIESREAQVKAWVHLDRDYALAEARRCDRAANRGPIHGIPFAAKDIMDTADMPTEYGSSHLQRQPARVRCGLRSTQPCCRRGPARKDSDNRVCEPISLGENNKPSHTETHPRWFLQRIRRCGGRFHGAHGLWYPDSRIGYTSRSVLRLYRIQTELRRGEHDGREGKYRFL